jgi:4-amino-4-deoxy-L-arabinose transferase-like glycosyltransferase
MHMRSLFDIKQFEAPRWYKIGLVLLFLVYVAFWAVTVRLQIVATDEGRTLLPPVIAEDSSEYAALSDSLLQGGGFTLGAEPEYFRSPGYPAFLAAIRWMFRGSYLAVTFVQVLLVFASALLVRSIAKRYFGSFVGDAGSMLFLANPYMMALSLTILSDALFLFLFVLGIFISATQLERSPLRAAIAASLVFSAAIYVRPMGIFALPIFIVPALIPRIKRKDRVLVICIILGTVLVAMLPWMMRNERQSGVLSFTSLKSYNLATYNVAMFRAKESGSSAGQERARIADETGIPETRWRDLRNSSALDSAVLKAVFSRPVAYAVYHAGMSIPFLADSDIRAFLYIASAQSNTALSSRVFGECGSFCLLSRGDLGRFFPSLFVPWWRLPELLFVAFLLVAACWCVYKMRKERVVWAFVFIIAYLMLLAGPVANARYRLPASPLIVMLAVAGVDFAVRSLRSNRLKAQDAEKSITV